MRRVVSSELNTTVATATVVSSELNTTVAVGGYSFRSSPRRQSANWQGR